VRPLPVSGFNRALLGMLRKNIAQTNFEKRAKV
jgi:hypothetical protein